MIGVIQFFPWEFRASEVAVSRGGPIDGAAQIQPIDNTGGPQIQLFPDDGGDFVFRDLAGPECFHVD